VVIKKNNQSSNVQGTCKFYSLLLIIFHRRTIFKMLALEQSAKKWPFRPFNAGGRGPTAPTPPPGYGLARHSLASMFATLKTINFKVTHQCSWIRFRCIPIYTYMWSRL